MPPQNIQILLPVWGERYTRDFLDLCLPSLMAPGNIPALSRIGRCTFVLLAPARDVATVERHALWALLRQHCSVSVMPIDDLVSQSGSTVLTLAYALAIRTSGILALDTCFVPLVADYVVSDGSLLAVVSRVFTGARAVLAGNFQISRERGMPRLQKRKGSDGVLAIHARDLVDLSLNSLHEVTLNDVVLRDQPVRSAANRFFWRVDDSCMIGRFYLMHMIALHPETADFVISAPSDYGLVPELCPSGPIVRMTDSDDYFVVECQPEHVSEGNADRVPQQSFARSLAVWATAMHHDNAQHALMFHS